MKLMTNSDLQPEISAEQYAHYLSINEVVSQEALSDYLYKIMDLFKTLGSSVLGTYDDRQVAEILSHQHTVGNKLRYLNFTLAAENIIFKPENFTGKYVDYVSDLRATFIELTPILFESGDILKLAISDYINNANTEEHGILYGYSKLSKNTEISKDLLKQGSKYFTASNGSNQANIRSLFKTFNDVKPIQEDILKIEKLVNTKTTEDIKVLYNTICMLLDHLSEEVVNSNISIKNSKLKKDLSTMVHDFAKILEVYGYFKSNLTDFYKVYITNIEHIIKL